MVVLPYVEVPERAAPDVQPAGTKRLPRKQEKPTGSPEPDVAKSMLDPLFRSGPERSLAL